MTHTPSKAAKLTNGLISTRSLNGYGKIGTLTGRAARRKIERDTKRERTQNAKRG